MSQQHKRGMLWRGLALLLVLAMVGGACGNGDQPATDPDSTSAAEGDAPPPPATVSGEGAAGPSTIRYFSMWNEGEPQQEVLQGIIDSFEAETGHEVDVLWGGREILTSVRAALSAGEAVDLVDLDAEPLYGALVVTGETQSLSDVLGKTIPGEGNTVGDVIPSAYLDVYAVDGEPHLIPYEVISSGIHYDGARLEGLGIDPPETWDEFIAASRAAGENAVQADGLINFYNAYWLYWLIVRHGGPGAFYDAAADPTGEAWRSGTIAAAVADLVELVESGALADGYDGSNYPLAQQEWAAGNGTFMVNGTWLASETSSYASPGFDYRLLSFPKVAGGHDSAELYQIGWVVPDAADAPSAAKDFIAYALNRERLAGIADVAKNLTPRTDIAVPAEIQDAAEIFAGEPPVHRIYDGVQGDFPEYWSTVFLPLDDQLFFGQINGQDFIDRIANATADYWADAPPAPVSGEGAAGPSTIRYFSMWNEGEPQQEVLQGIIDSFEAETGHEVDVLWGGREILTSVRAALSAGEAVDLVDLDAEPLYGALVVTGETQSLSDVLGKTIPGEGNTVGDVIPSAYLDVYAVDGEPHLIPYEVISSGIHYDGARLEGLGIDPPETWDEFIAASRAAGENAVQADGLINFYNAYWLYWLIVRHGGPGAFYDAAADPTGEAWRSGTIAAAVADLVELVESGALADGYDGSNYPLAQQEWAAGNGTFMVNGTWLASETSSYASPGFDYRLLSFPKVAGGHDSAELYQIGWVVPDAADAPSAAKDFIAYALNRERLAGIADVAKNLTPRTDIAVPAEIQDAAEIFAGEPPVHRIYDGVQGDFPEYWSTVFLPLDDQLFFGQINGQDFIDRIANATADYWSSR